MSADPRNVNRELATRVSTRREPIPEWKPGPGGKRNGRGSASPGRRVPLWSQPFGRITTRRRGSSPSDSLIRPAAATTS